MTPPGLGGPPPSRDLDLSILIVNYNTWNYCLDAVRTFRDHPPTHADGTPMTWGPIVVDNLSPIRDDAAQVELERLCAELGGKFIQNDENAGYSKGMNLAYAACTGRWILVSNPDIIYLANTVDPMLRAMERSPDIGAAAPRGYWDPPREGMLPPNILPTLRDLVGLTLAEVLPSFARRYSRKRSRDAVRVWTARGDATLTMLSGCCFLMRRELIEAIGFFDDRFPLYYEDTDLSVRIKRTGKRIVQVGGAEVIHLFDRSGQTDPTEKMNRYWKSRRLYYRKWYGRPGGLLYDLTRFVLRSGWAKRRRGIVPHRHVHDLGSGHGKPVIKLPEPRERFVVEFALDPKFYLAGGVVCSGDEWMPNNEMFKSFGEQTYWFRVVEAPGDASGAAPVEVGVWKYAQKFPAVELPMSEQADELGRRRLDNYRKAEGE